MNWYLLDSGSGAADHNMAVDEALLQYGPLFDGPVFRWYGWAVPAATFGYSQRFSDVEKLTPLRPLIRRPTGGGLVPHGRDWTYSLCVPPSASWYSWCAKESYRQVHEWLHESFALSKVPTELAAGARKEMPGQCFIGAEESDLLFHDKKIAGAAQRRNKSGLLIQGSIQPPDGISREQFLEDMKTVAVRMFQAEWQGFIAPPGFQAKIEELREGKYAVTAFNQKR